MRRKADLWGAPERLLPVPSRRFLVPEALLVRVLGDKSVIGRHFRHSQKTRERRTAMAWGLRTSNRSTEIQRIDSMNRYLLAPRLMASRRSAGALTAPPPQKNRAVDESPPLDRRQPSYGFAPI